MLDGHSTSSPAVSTRAHRVVLVVAGLALAVVAWILMAGVGTASEGPQAPPTPAGEGSSQTTSTSKTPPPGTLPKVDVEAEVTAERPVPSVRVEVDTSPESAAPEPAVPGEASEGDGDAEPAVPAEGDAPARASEPAPENDAGAAPESSTPVAPKVRVEVDTSSERAAPEPDVRDEAPERGVDEQPSSESDAPVKAAADESGQEGDRRDHLDTKSVDPVDRSAGTELAPLVAEALPELNADVGVRLAAPALGAQHDEKESPTGTTGLVTPLRDVLAVDVSIRAGDVGQLPGIALDVAPVDTLADIAELTEGPSQAPPINGHEPDAGDEPGRMPTDRNAPRPSGEARADQATVGSEHVEALTAKQSDSDETVVSESTRPHHDLIAPATVPGAGQLQSHATVRSYGGTEALGDSSPSKSVLSMVPAGSGAIGGASSSGGALAAWFGAVAFLQRPMGGAAFTGETGAMPDDLAASPDLSPD